jgi:hypothetical protein
MSRRVALVLALSLGAVGLVATSSQAYSMCDWATDQYAGYAAPVGVAIYPPTGGNSTSCTMYSGYSTNPLMDDAQWAHRGGAVWQLQDALNRCYGRSLTVDGNFGALTKAAVQYVQQAYGLSPDGVYGPKTAQVMYFPGHASSGYPWIPGPYSGNCYRIADLQRG